MFSSLLEMSTIFYFAIVHILRLLTSVFYEYMSLELSSKCPFVFLKSSWPCNFAGCSIGFECLISHWLTWRVGRTYGRTEVMS